MSLILLVEGLDDQHVTQHILLANGVVLQLGGEDEVHQCGGISRLLGEVMPATLKGSSYRAVGVIVDADGDLAARWQEIQYQLSEAGFAPPSTPDPAGTILTEPRIAGVWIMPDNTIAGVVENFIEQLIPDGDMLWPMSRDAVAAIPSELRRFAPASTLKAEIHTYLAWQKEPGTPLGAAIRKRYLSADGPTAQAFVAWVQRLRELGQD